jgi:hypothetical protein
MDLLSLLCLIAQYWDTDFSFSMPCLKIEMLSVNRDVGLPERRMSWCLLFLQVRIVREPSGKSRGFGFVAMDNEDNVRRVSALLGCSGVLFLLVWGSSGSSESAF